MTEVRGSTLAKSPPIGCVWLGDPTRIPGDSRAASRASHYTSLDRQKAVFETILRDCAEQKGKILTIHSVRAAKAVLDMIETLLPPSRESAVLHWFTGTKAVAARAVRLGMYFSINREMLRNERHRATVTSLPQTDGPFTKVDGREARPSDVSLTIDELAELRSIPAKELTEIVRQISGIWFPTRIPKRSHC